MSAVTGTAPNPRPASLRFASFMRNQHPILNIILLLVAIFWLVPSVGLAVISLRPEADFTQSGWWTVLGTPSHLTFANYQTLFSQGFKPGGLLDSLLTSIAITVPTTILVTALSSSTAYSLVFGRWPGRDVALLVIVGLLVVPLQMALIPVDQIYNVVYSITSVHIFGTVAGVVIFHVAFGLPFGIFLMRNFYMGIPRDLLEAGRIDGAGDWNLFRRVVLPIGLPAVASLAIFQFIWVWNDLLVALVFLGGSTHYPLTVFLLNQTRTFSASYWVISTGAMISIVIPLIVFFSFQRYFVQGVLAGSVK
jgi:alpha-glucoside transport system permease protein